MFLVIYAPRYLAAFDLAAAVKISHRLFALLQQQWEKLNCVRVWVFMCGCMCGS